jgi:hypothetical protein
LADAGPSPQIFVAQGKTKKYRLLSINIKASIAIYNIRRENIRYMAESIVGRFLMREKHC